MFIIANLCLNSDRLLIATLNLNKKTKRDIMIKIMLSKGAVPQYGLELISKKFLFFMINSINIKINNKSLSVHTNLIGAEMTRHKKNLNISQRLEVNY